MAQKKKTQRAGGKTVEINDILIQAAKVGIVLATRGIEFLEEFASKRKLYKTYPYLREAINNVKGIVVFLQNAFAAEKTGETQKKYEGPKRKKSHKKVSK